MAALLIIFSESGNSENKNTLKPKYLFDSVVYLTGRTSLRLKRFVWHNKHEIQSFECQIVKRA